MRSQLKRIAGGVKNLFDGARHETRAGYLDDALALQENGRVDEAIDVVLKGYASGPKDFRALQVLVKMLESRNRYDEAESHLQKFIESSNANQRAVQVLLGQFTKLRRYPDAIALGEAQVGAHKADQRTLLRLIQAHIEYNGVEHARRALEDASRELGAPVEDFIAFAEILECEGEYDENLRALRRLKDDRNSSRYVKNEAERRLNRLSILQTSRKIMNSRTLSKPIRGIAIIPDLAAPLAQLWQVPVATELRREGFVTVVPERRAGKIVPDCGIPEVDYLQGVMDATRTRLMDEPGGPVELRHEWTIDTANKQIEAEGINLFGPVCARIGTKLRSYNFDWKHPLAVSLMKESLERADAALAICKYVHEKIAPSGLAVRFLSGMSHFSPNVVYRHYCKIHRHEVDMEYIAFVAAYEHYFSNLKNSHSTALSVQNMTRYPELTTPGRMPRKNFEAWVAGLSDRKAVAEEIKGVISIDRAGVDAAAGEASEVRNRILAHKKSGGSVACLFGKIMYDIWMDDGTGPAHGDIVEWLNHSIASVKGTSTLLLVKPHPNEIKRHIARPNEFFLDLVDPAVLNDNVILLDHRWFNMDSIASMVDLGVLWSGTSALELQANGIPVAVCSNWGQHDHPVEFLSPRSREEYEKILANAKKHTVSPELQEECALLIKYYSTDNIIVPHNFGVMPYRVGSSKHEITWHADKVDQFMSEGDAYVSKLVKRIV